MSAVLKPIAISISTSAFMATFLGFADVNLISVKFGNKFGDLFTTALKTYVSKCTGLPVGGPVVSYSTSDLQNDLYKAGKEAFTQTFQGFEDVNQLAHKFGTELKPMADIISSYMKTCMTTPAVPPAVPVSPGGPLITIPSAICVPVFLSCSQKGFMATFQGFADTLGISVLFGTIFSTLGTEVGNYASRCKSAPGGGPLIAS